MNKEASTSWGFQTPLESGRPQPGHSLPSGVSSRKAGAGSTLPQLPGKLYDEASAAQHAFRKEAQSRRLHDKEFHAKQSIRKRQQEYDDTVKARLAQEPTAISAHGGSAMVAKRAQQQLQAVSDLQTGTGSLSGPRAKKLQAFARHPRPPQLPAPPRQISRIPDDFMLPEIAGKGTKSSRYGNDGMANLLADDDDQRNNIDSIIGPQISPMPRLASQARRLTQEMHA